ncbi:MAG: glycosyltransferase [Acidimicrobiia bacterium]|nr:glycosyltransferase [Acidimicrobiia bacterium]
MVKQQSEQDRGSTPTAADGLATGDVDIASRADQRRIRELADELIDSGASTGELRAAGADPDRPLDLRVAIKLALSKHALRRSTWSGRLGVVFAMWGEQRRLRPRGEGNPTGEDALHVKLDQLEWLFSGSDVDWRLYPVDDGDPEDSAAVAAERAAQHGCGHRVEVLRLAEAIPASTGPLAGLGHVDQSRKGGAIVHGAEVALSEGCDAIVMTDADNSVNLGQIGLLLSPFAEGTEVVIGDRKHPESVLVKAEARWGPGIVVLRHMQRMVGRAIFDRGLRDTQAAFKLYGATTLADVLATPSTYGFAFDSDWLYAAIANDRSIEPVPFAFIDSFAESASIAQGPMTTWESLLRGLVDAARARAVDHDEAMAAVIDDYAVVSNLDVVVQNVPPQLSGVADSELGRRQLMTPDELRNWLDGLLAGT